MQIITTITDIKKYCHNKQIGFVPTMGNLHPGHLSLINRANHENPTTIVSIFVNPTQFASKQETDNYPKTLEQDLELLKNSNVSALFLPNSEQMYSDNYNYQIQENKFSQIMEGKYRPNHFNGVLTIVMKLLLSIKPTNAYFGEKDYQQFLLIKKMAQAFFLDTNIIACPTIREPSGLAYSSRNNLLTPAARQHAAIFPQILQQAPDCAAATQQLTQHGFKVDYIEEHFKRRFGAVWLENVRLIDNY